MDVARARAAGSKAVLRQALLHKSTSATHLVSARCDCYKTAATVLVIQTMYSGLYL
jgi:hypothetical protein